MNPALLFLRRPTGGIDGAVARLHHAEHRLAAAFFDLSERHAADHEVHFVARDLARWSQEHVARLAEAGSMQGLRLDPDPGERPGWVETARTYAAKAAGRARFPGLLLLEDLRAVHAVAAAVSLDWEVLAQAAQAAGASVLTELAADCHPQTLRQLRWTNAELKEVAAQAVLST